MKNNRTKLQDGFSIVELLIVLTIVVILSTLAVLQFRSSKTDFERQNITHEFKVYLERARFDSVKRRAVNNNQMSRIILNSSSSFTVNLDFDGNGTLDFDNNGVVDPSDVRQVNFTQRSSTQILVSDTLNYPVTVRFDQRGHITATDSSGNAVDPVFSICSKNCTGSVQNNSDVSVLSVSTSGTVAILRGGQDPSALPTPAINATPAKVNCYVLVNTNVNSNMCSSVY
jgi:prepilin-type N-terminal cleavage/methylation domain-containing protein